MVRGNYERSEKPPQMSRSQLDDGPVDDHIDRSQNTDLERRAVGRGHPKPLVQPTCNRGATEGPASTGRIDLKGDVMTTAHGLPPSRVGLSPRPDARIEETPRFMRWLGWLLVSALVLGAAGIIWYGIANEGAAPVAGEAPVIANIDPWENPEVFKASLAADAFVWGAPGAVLATPKLGDIDPHVSPEAFRAPPVEKYTNTRSP